jgi:hypothetical protein
MLAVRFYSMSPTMTLTESHRHNGRVARPHRCGKRRFAACKPYTIHGDLHRRQPMRVGITPGRGAVKQLRPTRHEY